MNLIGQRGSRRERLGSEYHNEHHNNSAALNKQTTPKGGDFARENQSRKLVEVWF